MRLGTGCALFAAARAALRGPHGKPRLVGSAGDVQFTVAQCGDVYFAVIMIDADDHVHLGPLVRDVEDVRRLAERWLHTEETRGVGWDSRRFLRAWAR